MSSKAFRIPRPFSLCSRFTNNIHYSNLQSKCSSLKRFSPRNIHIYGAAQASSADLTSKIDDKDIVIVGGGVAGLSLACKIAHDISLQQGLFHVPKIAIIERFSLPKILPKSKPTETPYSNRVVSLTPASVTFLSEIDVWSRLDLNRVRPYQHIQVWDAIGRGNLHFEAPKDIGFMAYMVELSNLTSALMSKLNELSSDQTSQSSVPIEFIGNTAVSSIQNSSHKDLDWPIINLENDRQLQARVLVGADGANSPVRLFAGIESFGWDYGQNGIVATVSLESSNAAYSSNTAWQRFLPTGTLALLPLDDGFASIVWSVPSDMYEPIKKLLPAQQTQLLNIALTASHEDVEFLLNQIRNGNVQNDDFDLSWRATGSEDLSPVGIPTINSVQEKSIASFPLKLRHVDNYVKSRIALIGDAAHTVHPLAGQGLNLGIADSKSLGEVLVRGLRGGEDLGALSLLQNYASDRYFTNLVMLGATDKINRLFRATDPFIPKLRSLGLNLIDKTLPSTVKDIVVRLATRGFS